MSEEENIDRFAVVSGDPEYEYLRRQALYAERRVHAESAAMVHEARLKAKLTQSQLGQRIGTSQSAIARFEDPMHGVRTLAMMTKIAVALGYEFTHAYVEIGRAKSGRAVIVSRAPGTDQPG